MAFQGDGDETHPQLNTWYPTGRLLPQPQAIADGWPLACPSVTLVWPVVGTVASAVTTLKIFWVSLYLLQCMLQKSAFSIYFTLYLE